MVSDVNNPLLDDDEDDFSLPSLDDDLFLDKALPVVVNEPGTFPDDGDDEPLPSFDLALPSAPQHPIQSSEEEPLEPRGDVSLEKSLEMDEAPQKSPDVEDAVVSSPSFKSTFTGLEELAAAFDVDDDEEEVEADDADVLNEYYNQFGDDDEEEEDPLGGFDIDAVLAEAIEMRASDVDIMAGQPVEFTIMGDQVRQKQFPIPTDEHMDRIQQDLVSHVLNETFVLDMELDASYVIRKGPHKGRRLRLSVGRSFGNVFLCFRVISDRIPTLEDLKVSGELASWAKLPKGLVLMNGATGTGKALHVDEVVPTPEGMRRVGDVAKGDVLFDESGACTTVVDVHPSSDTKHFVVTFDNGVSLRTAGNHLWEVEDLSRRFLRREVKRRGKVLSTSEILERGLRTLGGDLHWGVSALSSSVAYSMVEQGNVSPWDAGVALFKGFGDVRMDDASSYLRGSRAQRVEFLRGVCSTDAVSLGDDGWIVVEGVSSEAVKAILEVVRSLGWEATEMGSGDLRFIPGDQVFPAESLSFERLQEFLPDNRAYLSSPRVISIVSIDPIDDDPGSYVCFEVDSPSHLFLCTDAFIPTHNSTTLASMVREVQMTRAQKIITIEKPVEYLYGNDGRALVVQREVGRDARSFSKALESAMRQHPNIILVGEVRNKVEVDALLYAADSGHLAISTTHATSASASVNRIKGFYEGDDLKRVLSSMGELSRGLASQALLKTPDGDSRFAVREVLSVDDEVADLISAGDVKGIQRYQDEREITMEHELVKAVRMGMASVEEARSKTDRPYRFDKIYESSFGR